LLYDNLYETHVKNNFSRGDEYMTKNPLVLTEDFSYWLGVLIGDGNMTSDHRYVSIVNTDEELLTNFQKIGENLFGLSAKRKDEPTKSRIFFYSLTLIKWLNENLNIKIGYAAPIKEVPSLVLQSPKSVIASFVRGLFDADGCAANMKGGTVIYVSRSKKLIDTVQNILLRFGIICSVRSQKDLCYRLTITGQDVVLFGHEIGFGLTRKQDLLMAKISEVKSRRKRVLTTTVVKKEEDVGVTYDFSVHETHKYSSGAFIHHNCATYTHYSIINRMHEKGLMTDGAMIEFLKSHTNVVYQPTFDSGHYSGINPYALGFAMMRDIERICKNPTEEDKRWFPDFAGSNQHLDVLKHAWVNYRDESFIRQYLSPKIARDFRMFKLRDSLKDPEYKVTAIHNDTGYQDIRDALANSYEHNNYVPRIEVTKMDPKTRSLSLTYYIHRGRSLKNPKDMLRHVKTLWGGYSVTLYDSKGNVLAS
jgi:SpoVR like protein/LAGLIDADG-like domain